MKKIKNRFPGRPKLSVRLVRKRLSISIHPNVKIFFENETDNPGRIIDKLISERFNVDISNNYDQDNNK
jgi:hypothetical protein